MLVQPDLDADITVKELVKEKEKEDEDTTVKELEKAKEKPSTDCVLITADTTEVQVKAKVRLFIICLAECILVLEKARHTTDADITDEVLVKEKEKEKHITADTTEEQVKEKEKADARESPLLVICLLRRLCTNTV